jgi:hypothetical protein
MFSLSWIPCHFLLHFLGSQWPPLLNPSLTLHTWTLMMEVACFLKTAASANKAIWNHDSEDDSLNGKLTGYCNVVRHIFMETHTVKWPCIQLLKPENLINDIWKLNFYLTEYTLCLHYKDHLSNIVQEKNHSLFRELYKMHLKCRDFEC